MINLCNDIITKDMCIKKILERFYNLEKLNNHNLDIKKEKLKINKNKNKKYNRQKKNKKDIDKINMNDLKNENILPNSISSIRLIKNENDKKQIYY